MVPLGNYYNNLWKLRGFHVNRHPCKFAIIMSKFVAGHVTSN
uniref:Uncharacterized protein n=1 Tax=Arundo donax TaxID=35708 RepID=A0A0A9BNC4_ARUDO